MIWIVVIITSILLSAIFALGKIRRFPPAKLTATLAGTIIGLLLGALMSAPLSKLPGIYGNVLPLTVSVVSTIIMVNVFLSRHTALSNVLPAIKKFFTLDRSPKAAKVTAGAARSILVDTSVIIDGRIADIAQAGFVPGKLLVTRFVLAELQNIADSEESMRRNRGRRGLEMLNSMRNTADLELEIIETDVPDVKEVDHKLVQLGKKLGAAILTTDYNLNRVAQIEGVRVLNINELSNAIRPVVLPGEEMTVKIVQAGKERGQGVGYLPDGTMIVVDNGDKLIGQEVQAEVTRVFQTVAGKMIFAAQKNKSSASSNKGNRHDKYASKNNRHHSSVTSIEDRLIRDTNNSDSKGN